MNAALDPAVSRFAARLKGNEEEAEVWRAKALAFGSLYRFLSQVIPYQDSDLERLYVFLRHLGAKLPKRKGGAAYQFDDEVRLEYYRLQKISEGSISLKDGEASPLDGPTEVGSGLARPQDVPLSQLIDVLNQRFETDFNQADQLFFDQIVEAAVADDGLKQAAAVNPGNKFELVFKNLLENLFVERMDQNEGIFVRFMNDPGFQKDVTSWMSSEAYRRLRMDDGGHIVPRAFRIVEGRIEDRFVRCVPLVPLKAAASGFSDPQQIEDGQWEWVEVNTRRRLGPGMFVAQVQGSSMEPQIPDGAFCLFASPVTGTRQGKTVLVKLHKDRDPESGATYTVKRYESEKERVEGVEFRSRVVLKPANRDFEAMVFTDSPEGDFAVIAELIEVLSEKNEVDRSS